MSKNAVVLSDWAEVCGFAPNLKPVMNDDGTQKLNDDGSPKFKARSIDLGKPVRQFSSEMANKIIDAYKNAGKDLDGVRVKAGQNAKTTVSMAEFLRNLAKRAEENGYLTAADFKESSDTSSLSPSKSHKIFTGVIAKILKDGFVAEAERGPTVEEIDNPVDLEEIEL